MSGARATSVVLRAMAVAIAILGAIDPVITLERPVRPSLTIAVQRGVRSYVGHPFRGASGVASDGVLTPEADSVTRHGSPEYQQVMTSAVVLQNLLDDDYDARIRAIDADSRGAACVPGIPCVLVGDDRWGTPVTDGLSSIVGAVRVPPREGPSVAIASATVPTTAHHSAVGRLDVRLVGRGVTGQRSTIDVLDGDVPVGSATYAWTSEGDATVRVDWWPMAAGVRTLSIRATRESQATGGGDRVDDDRVLIGAVVEADPYRVLVYDTRPSWTSTFVRRAIERDARVAVRLVARLGPQLQVTAGEPFRLDPAALADASLVVVGALDDLSARDVDVLETFVRVRGGSLILVPDRKPTGPGARLLAMASTERLEPAPIPVGDWRASELLVFRDLPDGATALARVGGAVTPNASRPADAVVVAVPSGNGRVIVSGAMDAWRYRDADSAAFDRAWQSLVADAAAAGGRPLAVTVDRPVVHPGDDVRVEVRLRAMTPIEGDAAVGATVTCEDDRDGRVGDPQGRGGEGPQRQGAGDDRALRLWPTGDRRVFEGHFAPTVAGSCRIAVTSSAPMASTATADVRVEGSDPFAKIAIGGERSAAVRETADHVSLDRLMRGSDGRIIAPGDETTLAGDVRRLVPAQPMATPVRPMRSPWWIVPFAACLGAEWWLRRRRGLR